MLCEIDLWKIGLYCVIVFLVHFEVERDSNWNLCERKISYLFTDLFFLFFGKRMNFLEVQQLILFSIKSLKLHCPLASNKLSSSQSKCNYQSIFSPKKSLIKKRSATSPFKNERNIRNFTLLPKLNCHVPTKKPHLEIRFNESVKKCVFINVLSLIKQIVNICLIM